MAARNTEETTVTQITDKAGRNLTIIRQTSAGHLYVTDDRGVSFVLPEGLMPDGPHADCPEH